MLACHKSIQCCAAAASQPLGSSEPRLNVPTCKSAGWEPNVPILHESTAGGMCSTFWRLLPQPTDGPGADTTYNSQARDVQ